MIRQGAVGCYTQQLNLDRASDALDDLDRAGQTVSAAAGAMDWPRVRTITLEISPDLVHNGVVSLQGYRLTSPGVLATLMQVYRNPQLIQTEAEHLSPSQGRRTPR